MDDLISRQAAVEVADAVWAVTGDTNVAKVWDQLKDLPSAEPRWIPVAERLPEDGERVLLQIAEVCLYGDSYVEDYYYVSGSRSKGRWFVNVHPDISVERGGIVAWLPLPEPWKGED